jgi:nicotinate phosphoribosyltransferase
MSIKKGGVTDIFYRRTRDVVIKKVLADQRVVMDVQAYSFSPTYDRVVHLGIEETACLFKDVDVNVSTIRVGTIFHRYEPVLSVEFRLNSYCLNPRAVIM